MNFINDIKVRARNVSDSQYYDDGLRKYMLGVYNYMASALGVSGLIAFLVASSPTLLNAVHATPLGWVFAILPIVLAFTMSSRVVSMSPTTMHVCFWTFASSMGVSLSYIFILYAGDSIARVFLISGSVFAATSLYGYSTRRDLSSIGSFMFMGLIGILIASLVNVFMRSSALLFATSLVGVVVFVGLTAYDMQRIKAIYYGSAGSDSATMKKIAMVGALSLYMDFINLFISMLHLLGNRRQ